MTTAQIALIALSACGLSGCVVHRLEVSPPEHPVLVSVIDDQVFDGAVGIEASSGLPIERNATWFWRDADGTLHRSDLRTATPLPWWQRFPADLIAEVYHADLVASHQAQAPSPAPIGTAADSAGDAVGPAQHPRPEASHAP